MQEAEKGNSDYKSGHFGEETVQILLRAAPSVLIWESKQGFCWSLHYTQKKLASNAQTDTLINPQEKKTTHHMKAAT